MKQLILTFAMVVTISGCRSGKFSQSFGIVEIKPGTETVFVLDIPKNRDGRRWNLLFGLVADGSEPNSKGKMLLLYAENLDEVPLKLAVGANSAPVTIQPQMKTKVFEGEVSELFTLGRGDDQGFVVDSSSDRKVSMSLRFVSEPGDHVSKIRVSGYYYLEGL